MGRRWIAPGRVRLAGAALCLLASAGPLEGQGLRDALGDLFRFGSDDDPLFLAGSAGLPETEVHGDHFIPDQVEGNGAVLDFFTNALAINVSSFPLPSTVTSETFRFVNGVPTPTSNSFGPITAERAQTVGRGRLNSGVNYSSLAFRRLRGVNLDDIRLTFIHSNVDFPNCDAVFQGDCTEAGTPPFENDVIDLVVDLDLRAEVYAFYATFGLTDHIDVGFAIPVVNLDLDGLSRASIATSTGAEADHFFGGTPENPVLESESAVRESATGLGDVAVRLKARLTDNPGWNIGILGELRVPTGREEDLLGTGSLNAKGVAIVSGLFDAFSPHANIGFEYRGDDLDQNELEIVAGFDHLLADWATVAVDLLGAFKVGESLLDFPEPGRIETPFPRTIPRTNLPDRRDDIIDAAFGFKFRTGGGLVVLTNVLVALNDGGLRSAVTPTFGLEYLF